MLDVITKLLGRCSTSATKFPPTELFNEGWMLRIVLDWFSNHPGVEYPVGVPRGADWYSEARLRSAFLARKQKDNFAESHTHADGVIGRFKTGVSGSSDLKLCPDAKRFVVIEAKMSSKLSPGITNAKYYNQAARTVACMAEIISSTEKLTVSDIDALGFYVLAPQCRIDKDIFKGYMKKTHIEKTVKRRVDEYDQDKSDWFCSSFLPVIEKIDVKCISWEEIIEFVNSYEPEIASSLRKFYRNCLNYNNLQAQGKKP